MKLQIFWESRIKPYIKSTLCISPGFDCTGMPLFTWEWAGRFGCEVITLTGDKTIVWFCDVGSVGIVYPGKDAENNTKI